MLDFSRALGNSNHPRDTGAAVSSRKPLGTHVNAQFFWIATTVGERDFAVGRNSGTQCPSRRPYREGIVVVLGNHVPMSANDVGQSKCFTGFDREVVTVILDVIGLTLQVTANFDQFSDFQVGVPEPALKPEITPGLGGPFVVLAYPHLQSSSTPSGASTSIPTHLPFFCMCVA